MKRYLKFIAIIMVLAGVWLVFWDPIDYITTVLGPVWSIILGVIIIIFGSYIGVKAF